MKLFKKMRKGFTLIELVVVIAVIAILSAVSVVSYISITNKAKQSNDQQKVDQVNISLAADQALNGKRSTVHDALKAVEEDGFKPENFKAESKDYTFAYSLEENKVVLLQNDKVVYPKNVETPKSVNLWLFDDSVENLKAGYSHYLRGENIQAESVTISAGLDVGKNTKIALVKYDRATATEKQTAVIRTNSASTNLEVEAPLDTIEHYGLVGKVDVKKIDMNCYNENGKAAYVKVTEGKIVAAKGGEISVVFANNTDGSKVAVVKENTGKIEAGYTTVKPTSDANKAREGGIDLAYSPDGVSTYTESAIEAIAEEAVSESISEEIANDETANYVARIGSVGYLSLKEAVNAAKPGEIIYLLDNCVVDSSIGDFDHFSQELVFEGCLENEVKLFKDVTITFSGDNAQIYLQPNGKFSLNGHSLKFKALSSNATVYYVKQGLLVEKNESELLIKEDLEYTASPDTLPGLLTYSLEDEGWSWEAKSFFTGSGASLIDSGEDDL